LIDEIKIFKNILINADQQDYVFIIDELLKSAKKLFIYKLETNQEKVLEGCSGKRQAIYKNYDNLECIEKDYKITSLYDEFTNNIRIINRLCKKNNTKIIFEGDLSCKEEVDKFLLDLIVAIYTSC
jgi:hypothetical protein